MHIADGIMAAEIALAADVVSLGAVYIIGKRVPAEDVPKMGLMAAALFVASLIHFPLAGTSIHLGLFGLAGILLGWQALPVVFAALLFQSLIFQHGGLLSVGLNALNMGMGALAAAWVWKISKLPVTVRAFSAGFLGIIVPALLMAFEFQASGYGRGILYITYVYLFAAAIEGILTLFVINFFLRVSPQIFRGSDT